MVALSSKTYYCRDSQGQAKLSSKGLQKKANADSLTYEAYRRDLPTGLSAVVSTMASGSDPVGKCKPIGRRGLPCFMCTLKGVWRTMASTQNRCTCEPHTACLPACLLTRNMATSSTANAGEYEMQDLQLQWPFRMLLPGCSGSCKSTLTTRLVALSSRVLIRTPAHVLVFYSHMQPAYRELARQAPCPVELLDGAKHFTEQLTMEPRTPVIVNNTQATLARLVSSWFTRRAHHYDPSFIWSIMFLTKTPATLPSAWMLLTSSCSRTPGTHPRSPTWTSKYTQAVIAAYCDATSSRAHSYVVIDFNQSTPTEFRLRNTLCPDEDFLEAFAYGPASQA